MQSCSAQVQDETERSDSGYNIEPLESKDTDGYLGHFSIGQFCEILDEAASLQNSIISVGGAKRKSNQECVITFH